MPSPWTSLGSGISSLTKAASTDVRWCGASVAEDTSGDPSPGYQCWWWVDTERPGRFFARGNLGQSIYVDPRTDVVIVRTRADFGIDTWRELLRAVAGKAAAAPFGP
jgi:CubicO group peptidase (beta-lactamase class C family)